MGNSKRHIKRRGITGQSVLFALAGVNAAVGLILGPELATAASFALSLVFLILGRSLSGALGLLWMVRFEPAPTDVLFAWSSVRSFIRLRVSRTMLLCCAPLFVFLILNFVQLLWAIELSRALFFFAATVYLALVLIAVGNIRDPQTYLEARSWYVWAMYINAMIIVTLGIMYLLGWNTGVSDLYYGNRPKAFFKDPNVAGAFAITGVLLSLANMLFGGVTRVVSIGMMLSMIAVILSFSRGALVGLVAGAASLGVIAVLLRRATRVVLGVASAIIVAVPVLRAGLELFDQGYRFQGLTEYDVTGRLAAWVAGLRVFGEAPWGVGPGQFEPAVATLFEYYSAHNTFLRVLVENGIFGVILIGTIIAIILSMGIAALRIANRLRSPALLVNCAWLLSCLVAIISQGMFIDALHWRHFWVLAGFIIANYRIIRRFIIGQAVETSLEPHHDR